MWSSAILYPPDSGAATIRYRALVGNFVVVMWARYRPVPAYG
jgi:hypothetical protein